MDSTFSTNKFKLILTVGFVINEIQSAVPFIYIISNSEKQIVLEQVFKYYKVIVGDIKPANFFMSDLYCGFYNAWKSVFGGRTLYLYCYYHFKKSLRRNLEILIKDKIIQMKICNMLLCFEKIHNEEDFNKFLAVFQLEIKNTNVKFYDYFMKNYAKYTMRWAIFHRRSSDSNTNNYAESWFAKLKRIYLRFSVNLTLERLVDELINIDKNTRLEIEKSTNMGKITTYRHKRSLHNHNHTEKLKKELLFKISPLEYMYNNYKIRRINDLCPFNCYNMCKNCNICLHLFICDYRYNLFSKEICSYIHLICIVFFTPERNLKNEKLENVKEQKNQDTDLWGIRLLYANEMIT